MKKFVIILVLVTGITLFAQASQMVSPESVPGTGVKFTSLFNHTFSPSSSLIAKYYDSATHELMAGGSTSSGSSDKFKEGVSLLVTGIACLIVGPVLIGLGILMVWLWAEVMETSLSYAFGILFLAYLYEVSEYAYAAIALIFGGAIVALCFLAIIPGIIFMASARRSERINMLNDNVGVSIKLGTI